MPDTVDLFRHLTSDAFRDAAADIAAAIRAGVDLDPAEIADRLGIPLGFLMTAAASYAAAEIGRPVLVVPTDGEVH